MRQPMSSGRPPGERGPFDDLLRPQSTRQPLEIGRGGVVALGIAIMGILLILLVIPPISLLSRGGGGGGENESGGSGTAAIKTTVRKDMPALPAGVEAVSPFYGITTDGSVESPAMLTLQIPNSPPDGRNISVYTYEDSGWKRLAGASLSIDGVSVTAELPEIPPNIVAVRRSASARQLIGYLPSGGTLSDAAAQALSVLDPVDYAPNSDGTLYGSQTETTIPEGLPVRPAVRVSTADDAAAIDAILASPDLRDEHINAILAMVESGHYDGVEIDYGTLDPLRKDAFSDFISNLGEQLQRRQLVLTVTAPLPVQEGNGWDTGAYDWARLSQAANWIELTPESDPSRYYESTEAALAYLIQDAKVAPAKMILRVSALGVEKGGEGLSSLTSVAALSIASTLAADKTDGIAPGEAVTVKGLNIDKSNGASGLGWDEGAEAVSFTYPGLGGARTVWIENAFSIGFKLDLVDRFGLAGIAVDDASDSAGAEDIWPVISEFLETGHASLVKPNGSLFVPTWQADGGDLKSESEGVVTWTAPDDAGTYAVTVIVSDGLNRVGQKISLNVQR
jgi:hypothetical protein